MSRYLSVRCHCPSSYKPSAGRNEYWFSTRDKKKLATRAYDGLHIRTTWGREPQLIFQSSVHPSKMISWTEKLHFLGSLGNRDPEAWRYYTLGENRPVEEQTFVF